MLSEWIGIGAHGELVAGGVVGRGQGLGLGVRDGGIGGVGGQGQVVVSRKQQATFVCPILGCRSTFTRSSNLKGWLSFVVFVFVLTDNNPRTTHSSTQATSAHTTKRNHFSVIGPGCRGKGFARPHNCEGHEELHTNY